MKPTFINWLLTEHKTGKFKIALSIIGVIAIFILHPDLKVELEYGLSPIAYHLIHLILITFSIAIVYQPYTIYKRLERLKWWERDEEGRSKFK
jgi:hypothetical protein|tara:strand:+ start:31 stop:309 length:279 start_codon:yes stop_codon:yes gene_type:complete